MQTQALLGELAWRGLLFQSTDGLAAALERGPVTGYCGFDPTAASLHVGNLIPVMGLLHLQRAGHRPMILVGGGTGLIGDPSGKAAERTLNTPAVVAENVRGIRAQLERFLSFDGPTGALVRDNATWLTTLGAIEFMRDVGKHFTVNYMLQKESVKSRLETGISYTEFSYMLLQAYDFLELYRREGVTLQVGGSDQWGNMTAGMELIRRVEGGDVNVLTFPLVTTAAGTKFGKTEAGAVWLDPARTSPYQFYQFWVNVDDRDVGRFLRFFTLLDRPTIEALDAATVERPEQREAQRALAADVTRRVHGEDALAAALEVSSLLFGKSEPASLSAAALHALAAEIPATTLSRGDSLDTERVIEALTIAPTALFKSKGEARRMIQQGGLYLNGARMSADRQPISDAQLLHGRYLLARKGARNYALLEVAP
ncbi:MAG TPA: tyrosine--tRNA ligase [Gemmatimonadaceae bacterium]|nr:tyrosine--tRNA ligase [Gemmatimonadaceae bacterium]